MTTTTFPTTLPALRLCADHAAAERGRGRAIRVVTDGDCQGCEAEAYAYEARCCSICDGVGHGYPGGGPCPLEDRGAYDGEPAWAL